MARWAGADELGDGGEGGEDREEQPWWAGGAGLGGGFVGPLEGLWLYPE